MTKKRKLVMATNNAHKLREARAIAGERIEILSLEDIGFDQDIPETADTLEGNALLKARAVSEATGLDCFADDTGLFVDALAGAPGVHTARYAGEACDPDANISLLLRNLEGAPDRAARFRTSVALSLNGEEHLFDGTVEGSIAEQRSGSHGFGYDPVFIPSETGVCFAEMTDDAKNAISHRGRAITAMIKWLSAICLCLFLALPAGAASSDWTLFNTFDDKVEHIFDTPSKTYFLVHAQLYDKFSTDNEEKLLFLFCKEKQTGEIRAFNPQNFLTRSLIRKANYNARKNYLLLVYDDYTIDLLHDDGKVHTIPALKNYSTGGSKEVRSISFDPDLDRAYLATDFGYVAINDKKYEVAASGLYNTPLDQVVRIGDKFMVLRDKRLYEDNVQSKHISLSDFKEAEWCGDGQIGEIIPLSSDRCLFSKTANGNPCHYVAAFGKDGMSPEVTQLVNLDNSYISENKDGLLMARYGALAQIRRDSGEMEYVVRRDDDKNKVCGSWDFRNFHYATPREGFYSVRREEDDSWTLTEQTARPNAPAVFRSNNLLYTTQYGMMANTHGIDQNFTSRWALNPVLLSGLKDQEWNVYGFPYLDPAANLKFSNPCGIAQDPDNPDVFYFGSVHNGLLRYSVSDPSAVLHISRSNDSPDYPGHVSVQDPYSKWSDTFMLTSPVFDSYGNLVVAHVNTETNPGYFPEIWIWTPEDRRASVSPETFRQFTRLKVQDIEPGTSNLVVPLAYSANRNKVVYFSLIRYDDPFVVYDHNGTVSETSDDRQATMKGLKDNDGSLDVHRIYCAVEDPATGLVWVGSDNGVFTFNPNDAFSEPGKVSRIKVSRNDGTSLADYLLSGIAINHIAIDGLGRKWFSLAGGGLVCTSSDGRTILHEIDCDNSMLPSDIVYASCFNPDNNSMMVATSAGLCEYYLNGQDAQAGESGARAYPNPVRHDYYGWVTIDGLEEDCIVKIADSAGNIVRELGPASAGRVQWDVCGIDLNRVPSGVYFVLASSGPGGGSYSEATKILVINR